MINLYLDSSIFACPSSAAGHDALEDFVEKLLVWRGWYERSWIKLLQLSSGIDVLSSEGYFPSSPRISDLVKSTGRIDLQAGDIIRLINSLMERAFFVEDYIDSFQLLIDKINSFSILPPECTGNREPAFEKLYQDLLIYSAAIQHLCNHSPDCPVAHVVNDSVGNSAFAQAQVKASISNISDVTPPYPNPLEIDENILICGDPQNFLDGLEPAIIWIRGSADDDIVIQEVALGIKVGQSIGYANEAPPWSFGGNFLSSAKSLGFGHEQDKVIRLMRACVETIMDRNTDDTHHLRTGRGANDPQRIRSTDDARAWRRDIDRHFHLHYWKIGSRIEFADVVPHNEFGITY